MHSRQVFNQSVCNCHEDSELVSTLVCLFFKVFVKKIYSNLILAVVHDRPCGVHLLLLRQDQPHLLLAAASRRDIKIFSKFEQQLFSIFNLFKGEIYQFLDDFDQHMEEEESIFQPLLNQYATFFSHSVKIS